MLYDAVGLGMAAERESFFIVQTALEAAPPLEIDLVMDPTFPQNVARSALPALATVAPQNFQSLNMFSTALALGA
jgi:hypothetical protein